MSKTFAVRSFGCQMNVYDSERMAEALQAEGLTQVEEDKADLVILNTCHIREKAAEKVYSEVGRIEARARRSKSAKPTITVAGCVAQAEGAEIARRAPAVDLVVGPQAYHRLPELLRQTESQEEAVVDLDMPSESKFGLLPKRRRRAPSAFLTVQEGCDKFCTFCVVPYTRGAENSRPLQDILSEAAILVENGARELTLLGQNVNAWCDPADESQDFGTLLQKVAEIPGLMRLRYMTSHPRDVTPAMIRAHGKIPELMPYLHLPVQSGSDAVLAAMNRRHNREFYFDLIRQFRAARPDLAITSDFIVGFPGETEEDFQDTLSLVEEVKYAQAFSFKYSPRLGTPAAESEEQVDEDVKSDRLARLQALLSSQSLAFNQQTVSQNCEILIERHGRHGGQWIGKSPWLQSVIVADDKLSVGDIVEVELVRAGPNSLDGRMIRVVHD